MLQLNGSDNRNLWLQHIGGIQTASKTSFKDSPIKVSLTKAQKGKGGY